jgi:lipopolysaccharide transport system ATP-binding protein
LSDYAIQAQNVCKEYVLGAREQPYHTLREALTRAATAPFRRLRSLHGPAAAKETIWALNNVSFEINRGEVVGIIGRNGAGKSTLLKILSRITAPTAGQVRVRGRVASLLEVGTGFHPELTGRENIFLNGAILGMARHEIARKFDTIVAFAEVEKFIDTPVKHYSSGMGVRLAFAVAAHLDPEILLVDEVLAVGDAEFQKKCIGKMNEASHREGRTVLFVSHNLEAILKLCSRGMLLDRGEILLDDDVQNVTSTYLRAQLASGGVVDLRENLRPGNLLANARLTEVAAVTKQGSWSVSFGERLTLDVRIESEVSISDVEVGIAVTSTRGFEVATWTNKCANTQVVLRRGVNLFRVEFHDLLLLPGQYIVGLWIRSSRGIEDHIPEAATFEVFPSFMTAAMNAHTFAGALVPTGKIRVVESAENNEIIQHYEAGSASPT